MTLTQLLNSLYVLLREPEYLQPAGIPVAPVNAMFPVAQAIADLNTAAQILLQRAGYAADLSDKFVTLPVVAGLDFALPNDVGALTRVEYFPVSQPYPTVLLARDFGDFDEITGGGFDLTASGTPEFYRVPYGPQGTQTIRLFPAPGIGNVNDKIILYYVSTGTPLVNPTDIFTFPVQFHEAPICYVLSRYWLVKNDPAQAAAYRKDFDLHVRGMKVLADDSNRTGANGSMTQEEDYAGAGLFRGGVI